MMLFQIPLADFDSSLSPDLILMLSILFGFFYFLVWRTVVILRGGIDGTETAGHHRLRFVLSSALIVVWIIAVGYLIFIIGVLPSYVTLVVVVLLALALFDLFRQHNNL